MNVALRNTGVNLLGDIPWGSHVCVFYESKDDLLDIIVPFFKTGLASNEFCLWAPSDPLTMEDAYGALDRHIPAFDRHLAAGHMEIVSGREWYLKDGRFERDRTLSAWDQKLRAALARGHAGMRVSGNAFSRQTPHWKDFCHYEHAVSPLIEGQPMIALCTYPIVVSGAADVLEVMRTHQLAIARRNGIWEFIESAHTAAGEHSLTPREREVLWWAAQGKSAREIGKILYIAKRTVDGHTQSAIRKLGAVNRTQAVATALQERLIAPTPV